MSNEVALWRAGAGGEWVTNAADGCRAALVEEDLALRFDFALAGQAGWAIARHDVALDMPEHYVVVLRVRGTGAAHELQVKLVDPAGANVWWWRRSELRAGAEPAQLVLRKATLDFAWGPASGGDPARIGAVEIAVASREPVSGSLWIDELRLVPRPAPAGDPRPVAVRASSARPGRAATHLLAGDAVPWHAVSDDRAPWLELDLGTTAEWGGVTIDTGAETPAMRLLASDDGARWTTVADSVGGPAGRRWLQTADGDGRFVRIAFLATAPPVSRVEVVPLELAVAPSRWLSARARNATRGRFPRHLLDEQAYWAIAAADANPHKALLGEYGAIELDVEGCTLEPFLWLDDQLVTWADVETSQSLADGHLPIPSAEWRVADTLVLRVTAFAEGATLIARYALVSTGAAPRRVRLLVAVRPFQVNPSWQRLNVVGGVSPIRTLAVDGRAVRVNDAQAIVAVSPPDGFGAAPTEVGLAALERGALPDHPSVDDPLGFAEGAWAFDVVVPAGGATTIAVAAPRGTDAPPSPADDAAAAAAWVDERLAAATAWWRDRLAGLPITLPPAAAPIADTLRASLGWILVNRDGPRIQPGTRCYRRSWIRDGALTGTALAEMGFADEAIAFLRWYAPHQLPDGRVPCAVDHHGVDLVPEHDSHGQLVWAIVELWRLTGDRGVLDELWPHALRAADAIAALRAQRMTDAQRGQACWGLLPESISHEGYSSRPVHSFWDDFFAVLGLSDAAEAAEALGDTVTAGRMAALRDDMRRDLHAAIRRSIADHGLSVIPGSVELGDFDPTSTAIAFDPCDEWRRLPADALRATFERYWEEFAARRDGTRVADAYTPYEVRTAAALVGLGQRARALELLDWLVADQRLVAWRQWPEIAWRDARAPRFLGDLPHGWIASSFVRTVRRLVVWEDRDARTLVLAAGVPAAWVLDPAGVRVACLPTRWGPATFAMKAPAADRLEVDFAEPTVWPPGGMRVHSPLGGPVRAATADGRRVAVEAGVVVLDEPARQVVVVH